MRNIAAVLCIFALSGASRLCAAPAGQPPAAQPAAQPAAAVPAQQDPYEKALADLASDSPVQRRQAVVYLGGLRAPKTAPQLLSALDDKAPQVRRAAVDALGLLAWREASPRFCALLEKDPDANVRQQAAISLSYLMDAESGPSLVKALSDASEPVRYAALRTLGTLRYKPAEQKIAAMLEGADAALQRSAISSLGMLKSTASAGEIAAALNHKDQFVRLEAARALGEIGAAQATRELTDHLAPAEAPAVRAECALALARLGVRDGLPVAREFISSGDLNLKGQALAAIVAVLDVETLPQIEKALAAEKDPAAASMLEFARQRLADHQAELKASQKK